MWKIAPDGTLTELTQDLGAEVGVWVPSEQVGFHYAELPPGRQSMWEKTVAFALEEQLITPVDEQHFVIGRVGGDTGKVPVAVVAVQVMREWLDAMHERGLKPQAAWPDVLAVPFERDRRPVLWHEGGRCLLRYDAQTGLAGSLEWIESLLAVGNQADDMRIFSDDVAALPEAWRERAEALPCSLDERMRAGPDQAAAAMNFLQGAFRPMSVLVAWGKPWRWAGTAAAAALALYMVTLAAETRTMNAAVASLQQVTSELYRQHFPEQPPGANLRAQVERRMEQIKGGVNRRETSPWRTLVRVEPAISSCKACRVEEVNFEKSSVSLVISSSGKFDGLLQQIGNLKEVKVVSKPLSDKQKRKRLRLELAMGQTG